MPQPNLASNRLANLANTDALPPAALSPSTFSPAGKAPDGASGPLMSSGGMPGGSPDDTLSASDRASLQAFLLLFRAARADAKSTDKATALIAQKQLATQISYLLGFFDARGQVVKAEANVGFGSAFGELIKPNMTVLLDELDRGIVAALMSDP